MEKVLIIASLGFNIGLIVLYLILRHELNSLKAWCAALGVNYNQLKVDHNRIDELLTDQHEVIDTLVQLSNETTKWIQEVSPVVRRKLL